MPPVKRKIIHEYAGVGVQPNPFADDPKAKMLIVYFGDELEEHWIMLTDGMQANIHDATAPYGVQTFSMSDVPKSE